MAHVLVLVIKFTLKSTYERNIFLFYFLLKRNFFEDDVKPLGIT
uniref:Uncharacterized protein n=1 Tax=uncultured Sphingobacteriales bacterium HF0010_19H17 TaxID=710990 RepID=E0XRE2_9SPHI|nr:hypothetical protein [uncultured Sphingobacteriales bacterium HF0010_19H17]